jgi:tRNA pseudouridine38-40 synthase
LRNIRLILEYDGTEYYGFQDQVDSGLPTIQSKLQQAIFETTQQRATVIGAGRTDAGVHAQGQVVNFYTDSRIETDKLVQALNARLPGDIAVIAAENVDPHFHARKSAISKTYRYCWYNRNSPSPFYRRYSQFIKGKLDLEAMAEAAKLFVGEHDFAAFRALGSTAETTVRTVYKASIGQRGPLVLFEVNASGFLYKMMRTMAGTIIEIGLGRKPVSVIDEALKTRDRKAAGQTAPSRGLCLMVVEY